MQGAFQNWRCLFGLVVWYFCFDANWSIDTVFPFIIVPLNNFCTYRMQKQSRHAWHKFDEALSWGLKMTWLIIDYHKFVTKTFIGSLLFWSLLCFRVILFILEFLRGFIVILGVLCACWSLWCFLGLFWSHWSFGGYFGVTRIILVIF